MITGSRLSVWENDELQHLRPDGEVVRSYGPFVRLVAPYHDIVVVSIGLKGTTGEHLHKTSCSTVLTPGERYSFLAAL